MAAGGRRPTWRGPLDANMPDALLVQTRVDTLRELQQRVARLEGELALVRAQLLAVLAEGEAAAPPGLDGAPRSVRAPTSDGVWRVTMLGAFRLVRDGREPAACPSRRGRSILRYLLASPGYTAAQAVLVETFWPSAEPATGAHNLQMAVHALRRSLVGWGPAGGDDVVLFRQDQYQLNPRLHIELDVQRFRDAVVAGQQSIARGDLAAARRAFEAARREYGGSYLSDTLYEDWAEPRRAELLDTHLCLLGQLGALHAQARDWDHAATCCEEILAADAYREDAYRALMRCHAARGRPADVQRVFETCRARLQQELQVAPAPETTALYGELLWPTSHASAELSQS